MSVIALKEKITELEEKADILQKNAKYIECHDTVDELYNLKKIFYGEESEEVERTGEKLCELCNMISMIYLSKENLESALDILKKAEILCKHSENFKAVTFNNLACFYRRTGKLRTALHYLNKTLETERKLDNAQNLADTHLNLCAVLSQLNRHEEALKNALISIVLLQDEFMNVQLSKKKKNNQENAEEEKNKKKEGAPQDDEDMLLAKEREEKKMMADRAAVLAIAYHNLAVEQEFLKRYDESIKTYQKAVNFGIENLGPNDKLVENLKGVLENAIKQIENLRMKEIKKKNDKEAMIRNKNGTINKNPNRQSNPSIGGNTKTYFPAKNDNDSKPNSKPVSRGVVTNKK